MNKAQKFDNFIYHTYGQNANYDKIRHQLLNVRENMLVHKSYMRMSAEQQYKYAVTISIIATQTVRQHMDENMPLSKPRNEKFPYSIDRDWKEVVPMQIGNRNIPELFQGPKQS